MAAIKRTRSRIKIAIVTSTAVLGATGFTLCYLSPLTRAGDNTLMYASGYYKEEDLAKSDPKKFVFNKGAVMVKVDPALIKTNQGQGVMGKLVDAQGKETGEKVLVPDFAEHDNKADAEKAANNPKRSLGNGICNLAGQCKPPAETVPGDPEKPNPPGPTPPPNPTPPPPGPTPPPNPTPPPPPPGPQPDPVRSDSPGPPSPDPDPAPSSVVKPRPTTPLPPAEDGDVGSIPPKFKDAVQDAAGKNLVDSANRFLKANADSAQNDETQIENAYKDVPIPELKDRFQRSEKNLSEQISDLESAKTGLDPSDSQRFKNVLLNARDKAAAAQEILTQSALPGANNSGLLAGTPFQGMLDPKGPLGSVGAPDLSALFGTEDGIPANSNEALINRVALHEGLPVDLRTALDPKLKLFEKVSITLKNGKKTVLPLLHNGYILGGSITGLDCSSLVTKILPPEIRKTRFTTLDMLAIWLYRMTGVFPKPPVYPLERKQLIMGVASAFEALDLRSATVKPGDLLVYRFVTETNGHVMIVQSANMQKMQADIIEASQSAGGVRSRTFDLSIDPLNENPRVVRPGLFALRLKPTENKSCGRVMAGNSATGGKIK